MIFVYRFKVRVRTYLTKQPWISFIVLAIRSYIRIRLFLVWHFKTFSTKIDSIIGLNDQFLSLENSSWRKFRYGLFPRKRNSDDRNRSAVDRENRRSFTELLFLCNFSSPLGVTCSPTRRDFLQTRLVLRVLLLDGGLEGGKACSGAETHWHTFRTLPFLRLRYHKTGETRW